MGEAGVSLWREVYDQVAREIRGGALAPGDRLPPDIDLAAKYGVARQTMRRALSTLRDQGYLRIEQGRGTFVTDKPFDFRIGEKIFLDHNLMASHALSRRRIVSIEYRSAPSQVAAKLEIGTGDLIAAVRVAGAADGREIGCGENIFSVERFPELKVMCEQLLESGAHFSFSDLFEKLKRSGLHRAMIRLSARPPTVLEETILKIDRREYVIETASLIIDGDKSPCYFSFMSYPSSKVSFYLDDEIALT